MAIGEEGWFAPRSLAFLAVLAGVIIARWLDPLNSLGEQSTQSDLQKFSVRAAGIGIVVWIVANYLGSQGLIL